MNTDDPRVPEATVTRCPGGKTSSVWLHRANVRPLMIALAPNKSADETCRTLNAAIRDAYNAGVEDGVAELEQNATETGLDHRR